MGLTRSIRHDRAFHIVAPALVLLGLIVGWELYATSSDVPQYVLPAPTDILAVLLQRPTLLVDNALVTGLEVALAFALSAVIGITVGVAAARSARFRDNAYPLIVASQAIPKLAIAPLFTVWFGFGIEPKVAVAFLIAFFPVAIGTAVGFQSVSHDLKMLGRSIGLTPAAALRHIELPSALPHVFGGLRVAATFAVIGAVVGEFLGADAGLGRLTAVAAQTLDTALLFAALLILALMGLAAYGSVALLGRLLAPWEPQDDGYAL